MSVRPAHIMDFAPLARLWWQGWRDGHSAHVAGTLVARRTQESFIDRLAVALPRVRVVGPIGAPLGFHLVNGDELNQLYVDEDSRGTGIAALLMADAEDRMLEAGVRKAWLACAVGNLRAARFYDKAGWSRTGIQTIPTEIPSGWFPLKIWRYEKRLTNEASAWAARAEVELFGPRLAAAEGVAEPKERRPDVGDAPRTIM